MKKGLYIALSAAAPVMLLLVLWGVATGDFGAALAAGVAAALLMEGRVRAGGRVPHDTIFYVHLIAAVLLVLCLGAALWSGKEEAYTGLAWGLCVPALAAGAVLWYRGLRQFFA